MDDKARQAADKAAQAAKLAEEKAAAANAKDSIVVQNGMLHVHLHVGKGTMSSTGKSLVCASTGGFKPIEGTDYSINLVVIQKVKS